MKRTNKFKYNKENTLSRLFAQNRRRNPRHDEDEEEDDRRESHGGAGAAAMGLGAAGLGLAGQGLSALGTVQGVHEQGKGIKGWFDRNKRRKEDYKKFGGDEKLMERKRDQAYRLSKTAKNSAQEAALKHRESEISDSLEWAKKRNNYKRDMAKQTSWAGKGATWAKHNPMKAGLAAAGVAAAAGGAYYMWKKRQEEKKRKQREREAQTRHQSRQFAGAIGSTLTRGLGKGLRKFPKRVGLKKFPKVGGLNHSLKPKSGMWGSGAIKPKTPFAGARSTLKNSSIASIPKPAPMKVGNANRSGNSSIANTSRNSARLTQNKVNNDHNAFKLHDDRMNARKAKERKAELTNRREAKQNDQARRDLAQKKAHERQIGHKEQKVRDLAKQTENLKTSGSGVFSHEYKQSRNELRNANIDLHNTKYKDNKVGDLVARAGGLKKFDKNGNLRWGKKRLALAGLGAAAAYNMMKDDDDK
nr:MAG TPA: hypothetical protein [Caudoviricetes sp.]